MKIRFKGIINSPALLLFLCFFLLSSCITTREDVIYLNQQIVALNNRVNELEVTTDKKFSDQLRTEASSIRENQAEIVSEIDKVKGEMQGLTGRVENNSLLIKRSVERETSEQDAIKTDIASLKERIAKLEEQLDQMKSQPPARPTESDQPPQQTGEKPSSPDEQLYNTTLDYFQEGEYEKAIEGFKNFLNAYPASELADNAQFWIGESYMAMKQYEQAILAYQKVIKDYPNGNKVPNAILRQAVAFSEINDTISAKLLLKKVIKNYPDTPEAKIAESKLIKLEQR